MLAEAIFCMALNIYHEARGESTQGQAAVAYTVLNRAKYRNDKVCDTILNYEQYSWTNGYYRTPKKHRQKAFEKLIPTDLVAWRRAKIIAELTIKRKIKNPIGRADHYFNPGKANPRWASKMVLVAKIGDHEFYYSGKFKDVS